MMDTEWEETGTGDTPPVKDPDMNEFLEELIDMVEDFLWTRQVDLKNTKDPRPDTGWGDEQVIYGSDYEELRGLFIEVMERWNLA